MKTRFRKAELTDAELLIDIYNSSFYDDGKGRKCHSCPIRSGKREHRKLLNKHSAPEFFETLRGKTICICSSSTASLTEEQRRAYC